MIQNSAKYIIVFVLAQLPLLFVIYMCGEDMFTRSLNSGFEWFFAFSFGFLTAFSVFISDMETKK